MTYEIEFMIYKILLTLKNKFRLLELGIIK